jgi:hypothetical protein
MTVRPSERELELVDRLSDLMTGFRRWRDLKVGSAEWTDDDEAFARWVEHNERLDCGD